MPGDGNPPRLRAALGSSLLATFVALVAGYWLPALRLPLVDLASWNGQLLVPSDASASFLWTVGTLELFGGGAVMALLYAYYVEIHLPGSGWTRGAIWGVVLSLGVGLTLVPLLYGGGIFGNEWDGRMPLALIVWHLLWGIVLGIAYHKDPD